MASEKNYVIYFTLGVDKRIYLKGDDCLFTKDIAEARIFPVRDAAKERAKFLYDDSNVLVGIAELDKKELFCKRLQYKSKGRKR